MNVWLVLPMKSLREGKTRLAPLLDIEQRRALLEKMFRHTLEQAAHFPGLERTLVVSASEDTRARAATFGAQVLAEEAGAGLNGAMRQAQQSLRQWGASHMMVVHCDLPRLAENDLRRLAHAADSDQIGIAPDRMRLGTNGLSLASALDFGFSFGPDSFALHLEQARQLGVQPEVVDSPGLSFDVDQPEDFARLGDL
ncbi:MAG: 2-phospho-L-lactate guanylyltransferase [Burkholderiales bacterium]